MTRGRKPMPTQLKMIKGERQDRVNHDEPQPETGIPICPVSDRRVNEVWDYTVEQLRKMRVLTMADRDPLLAYCQAVVMHHRCSELLDGEGYLWQGSDGDVMVPHPAVKMQREAALLIKQFGAEFGLTPSARTRIKVGDQEPAKEQGANRLLSS
jgi:P27 family predicted phage terminase small subunit